MRPFFESIRSVERSALAFVFFSFLILISGVVLSLVYCEFHIMNRVGALIVAVSLLLTLIQFSFEGEMANRPRMEGRRARRQYEDRGNSRDEADRRAERYVEALKVRLEGGRRHILLASLSMAALGEVIHGFGDTLIMLGVAATGGACASIR